MKNSKFKIQNGGRRLAALGVFAFCILHFAFAAAAASVSLAWDASSTPGCTYLIYAATNSLSETNLTRALVKVNAGTNLTAAVEGLTGPARWYFVATANLGGVQSEPSNQLVLEVPGPSANLRTVAIQYSVTVTNFSDVGFFRLRIPAPAP